MVTSIGWRKGDVIVKMQNRKGEGKSQSSGTLEITWVKNSGRKRMAYIELIACK